MITGVNIMTGLQNIIISVANIKGFAVDELGCVGIKDDVVFKCARRAFSRVLWLKSALVKARHDGDDYLVDEVVSELIYTGSCSAIDCAAVYEFCNMYGIDIDRLACMYMGWGSALSFDVLDSLWWNPDRDSDVFDRTFKDNNNRFTFADACKFMSEYGDWCDAYDSPDVDIEDYEVRDAVPFKTVSDYYGHNGRVECEMCLNIRVYHKYSEFERGGLRYNELYRVGTAVPRENGGYASVLWNA